MADHVIFSARQNGGKGQREEGEASMSTHDQLMLFL